MVGPIGFQKILGLILEMLNIRARGVVKSVA